MKPAILTFVYCYDGEIFPPPYTPVLCLFRELQPETNIPIGKFKVATAVQDLNNPSHLYWIEHNALEQTSCQPYAYLAPETECDLDFMSLVHHVGELHFQIGSQHFHVHNPAST